MEDRHACASRLRVPAARPRIGGSAPVYMTAVVEYIVAEVLDLAGQQTSANKRKRVTPEDVMLAIR